MTRFILTIFVSLFIVTENVEAQMGKLYNADDQLSSSFVNQVFLDRDGFIWVATRNGLNKYDGYQFRQFKKDDTNGMANNYVNCMVQDLNGHFYLGMFGSLQLYDGSNFKNVSVTDLSGREITCYVNCFLRRKNGDVLAGTSANGVLIIDNPKQAHQLKGELANITHITSLLEDHLERVWIATEHHGLILYKDGKILKRFFTDEKYDSRLTGMCEDQQGRVYIGTTRMGAFRLNNTDFEHIDTTGDMHVATLFCKKNGDVMMGLDGAGVALYNPENGNLVMNPYYSRDVDLDHAKVYSILEDAGGNIWLGMLQKGLYLHPSGKSDFKYLGYKLGAQNLIGSACVTSTLIHSKGHVFIGTDKDGLYQLSMDGRLEYHYVSGFPSTVLTLVEDKNGRVWLGSYKEGCGWIDPSSHSYHSVALPQGPSVSVFDICDDTRGSIWLGTMGYGLVRMSHSDGSFKTYSMKNGADTDRKVNSLVNDYISKMAVSPDKKRLYLAATTGVCCLDIDSESWIKTFGQNCLLHGTPIRTIKEFSGRLWIGTNYGLYSYDLLSGNMKQYTEEKGISQNGIASIEQDNSGKLWVSTEHGLCCLNPKTDKTEMYYAENGLQSNEFSDGASCKGLDGVLLFGGVAGVTWFDPSEMHPSDWNPTVKLTALILNGEPVDSKTRSGRFQVCDTTVMASKKFNLSYRDNSFTIQLSTLTYESPEQITYCYSINNDPEVQLQPGQNEITFSHLSPGRYRFKIRALHNSQSTPQLEFTVHVHSPWWSSFWAYLVYLSAFAVLVWLYLRYREDKEQSRMKLQEHIHAEQLGEAKLSSFMNISHEIRTPMTLILTPLNNLIKTDNNSERRSIYETMRRNAERILGLINQMMDIRKIDKGMMLMRMQETDLVGFLDDINSLFAHQSKTKQITFTYEHQDEKLPVWIDRTNFDKVIMNLLSNAFKFTPTGGKILMQEMHDGQNAIIKILDNGEAVPADKLERIFDRFYQTPSSVNDRNVGTGIGLDLTRSLVELHHGTIKVENITRPVGDGSKDKNTENWVEFTVTIPLGKSHLKPDEILEKGEEKEPEIVEPENTQVETVIPNLGDYNRPFSIIVAEDDDEIRDYLGQELRNGFVVQCCANGKEALAATLKHLPDLVISDIMMPEMDGNTLAATLKQNPHTNHIPIILLTAKNRDEDHLEGLESGADAFIVKPFNMDILRRTAINLIQSRRRLQLKYARNDQLEDKVETVTVKSPDEKLLERIMTVINNNISKSSLSVDSLAEEVGISRVHLHRKMKELTGQTPHDFIRNIRLKQAANLLSEGDMNVAEIVYACGFGNAASFATVFKKYYGMSPREFMQQHSKE